jgi:hypothetical protein
MILVHYAIESQLAGRSAVVYVLTIIHCNFCLLPLISLNLPLLTASRIKLTAIFPTTSHANKPTRHAYPITGNRLSGITPKTRGSKTTLTNASIGSYLDQSKLMAVPPLVHVCEKGRLGKLKDEDMSWKHLFCPQSVHQVK